MRNMGGGLPAEVGSSRDGVMPELCQPDLYERIDKQLLCLPWLVEE